MSRHAQSDCVFLSRHLLSKGQSVGGKQSGYCIGDLEHLQKYHGILLLENKKSHKVHSPLTLMKSWLWCIPINTVVGSKYFPHLVRDEVRLVALLRRDEQFKRSQYCVAFMWLCGSSFTARFRRAMAYPTSSVLYSPLRCPLQYTEPWGTGARRPRTSPAITIDACSRVPRNFFDVIISTFQNYAS